MNRFRRAFSHSNNEGDLLGDKEKFTMKDVWENWRGFIIATLYGLVSISITFFNKAVFAVYGFDASNALTLGQIIFSIIFLEVMKRCNLLDYENFNIPTAKKLLSLSLAFCGMVVTGLAALRFVNVPMYSALRRLTTLIVIVGQYFWLNKTVSRAELNSVLMMVFGALIASYGDLMFDLRGYFLTTLNCVVTAAYLILIAKKSKETGLKTFSLMYYNNILSIPFVLLIVYYTEWEFLMEYKQWNDVGFQICFLLSSVFAFFLNYLVFLCSTVNSPLTTSITGQLKSILSTLIGLFMFNDVVLTPSFTFGLVVSTLGGLWYGQVKYEEQIISMKSQQDHSIQSIEIRDGPNSRKDEDASK